MPKRKPAKSTNNKSHAKLLLYLASFLTIVAIILATLLAAYYFGKEDAKSELKKSLIIEREKKEALSKEQQESGKRAEEQKSINERLQDVLKKEPIEQESELPKVEVPSPQLFVAPPPKIVKEKKLDITASHEIDGKALEKLQGHKREKLITSHKPKLAIIMDDVSTKAQVKAIRSLNLPIVISFLPPSKGRSNAPFLASKEKQYMVHLPLEAENFSAEEPYTLHVNDSQEKISQRISEIKKLFPRVEYVNNHTGSKFTANEQAMNRLIIALNENNIKFIDSRTTGKTKVAMVLKNHGLRYLGRDVFLDHHMDKPYVIAQIKKAVKIAKSHGTAIAIGHPHKNTLQALRESKKVLEDVELVFVNQL